MRLTKQSLSLAINPVDCCTESLTGFASAGKPHRLACIKIISSIPFDAQKMIILGIYRYR